MWQADFEVTDEGDIVRDGYVDDAGGVAHDVFSAIDMLAQGEYALVIVEDTPEAHELLEKLGKVTGP